MRTFLLVITAMLFNVSAYSESSRLDPSPDDCKYIPEQNIIKCSGIVAKNKPGKIIISPNSTGGCGGSSACGNNHITSGDIDWEIKKSLDNRQIKSTSPR